MANIASTVMVGAATGGAAGALLGRQQSLARENKEVAEEMHQVEQSPAGSAGAHDLHVVTTQPQGAPSLKAVALGTAAGAAAGLALGVGLSRVRRSRQRATGLGAVVELAKALPAQASDLAKALPSQASSLAHHATDDGRALAEHALGAGRRQLKRSEKAAKGAAKTAAKLAKAQAKKTKVKAKAAEKAAVKAAKLAAKHAAKASREKAHQAIDLAEKRTRKARREAGKRLKSARKEAAQLGVRSARRVLAEAGEPERVDRRHGADLTDLAELRDALDETIASGEAIPYDRALVTRMV